MNSYKDLKVLVTGGTGFIGSRLVERLVFEEGAEVNVLVNNWSKATWVSRFPVNLIKGSINSVQDLEQAMEGCSIVFHCVGLGGTLEEAIKINVEGTRSVLEASKSQGIRRVVYLSSAVVHGPATPDGMDENAPFIKTGDAYGDSKIEAEKLFWDKTAELNIEGVVLRPTYVWGVNSPYYTIDYVNQMKAGSFTYVDEGKGTCNAVHVDNVVDVALLGGMHPKAVGESFLVTDAENMSWHEFYEYYAAMTGYSLDSAVSVYSNPAIWHKLMYRLKSSLNNLREVLTEYNFRLEPWSKILAKLFLKAPRKLVKMSLKPIERRYPEMASWDLLAYGSRGRVDISKLKDLLGYVPGKPVEAGMKECEVWLRDQNYI